MAVGSKRIAIGTAQFGLVYGVANRGGQVQCDEAASILTHAFSVGVDTLDTAIAYGTSEQCLGEIGVAHWRVVTKLPPVPDACPEVPIWVRECILGSVARLRVPRLYGLLLHRPGQLLDRYGEVLHAALASARREGLVEKIGISIYDPDELDALFGRYAFDIVQAPLNVLDRRLVTSGWLSRLAASGIEVHVRSVFLQGLLLMDASNRPEYFSRWNPLLLEWQQWLWDHELSALQACLGFVGSQADVDRVIVGVETRAQLGEILSAAQDEVALPPPTIASTDPHLINPRLWT